jgi:hypothetical protein
MGLGVRAASCGVVAFAILGVVPSFPSMLPWLNPSMLIEVAGVSSSDVTIGFPIVVAARA